MSPPLSDKHSEPNITHLRWLIQSRDANQQSAVRLLDLMVKHGNKIRREKLDLFAQMLVGVTFSLWRAVFLADKIGLRKESFPSAVRFLEIVVADNAINYPQDKKEREWTFNYYTNNVRFTMMYIASHKKWKHLVPTWHTKSRPPRDRWEYGQEQLNKTIDAFERRLSSWRSPVSSWRAPKQMHKRTNGGGEKH